jgi:hypothetical protein
MYAADLVIAGHRMGFSTECQSAYAYLASNSDLVGIRPYEFRPAAAPAQPLLHYSNEQRCQATFDAADQTLTVSFPWHDDVPRVFDADVPFHNMLLYSVRFLLETIRQGASEYTVHGSAVVKAGRSVVVLGEAEAGKTTTALHLCREFGFALFANDQVVVGERDGLPWLVHGDDMVTLRFTSTARYSQGLADRVFSAGSTESAPWNLKKDVPAHSLGLAFSTVPAPIALFVKIKLDSGINETVVRVISSRPLNGWSRASQVEQFFATIELYGQITTIIRGSAFTPLSEEDFTLMNLFVPNLDQPAYLERRVSFMNALFGSPSVAVISVRGPLQANCEAIVKAFESLNVLPDR